MTMRGRCGRRWPGDVDGDPPDRARAVPLSGPHRRGAGRRVDVLRRLAGPAERRLAPAGDVDGEPDARPRGREHAGLIAREIQGARFALGEHRGRPEGQEVEVGIDAVARVAAGGMRMEVDQSREEEGAGSRSTSRAGPSTRGPAPAIRPPAIATAPGPSSPVAGQTTRPAWITRSKGTDGASSEAGFGTIGAAPGSRGSDSSELPCGWMK